MKSLKREEGTRGEGSFVFTTGINLKRRRKTFRLGARIANVFFFSFFAIVSFPAYRASSSISYGREKAVAIYGEKYISSAPHPERGNLILRSQTRFLVQFSERCAIYIYDPLKQTFLRYRSDRSTPFPRCTHVDYHE